MSTCAATSLAKHVLRYTSSAHPRSPRGPKRQRAITSLLCNLHLVGGRYQCFVDAQPQRIPSKLGQRRAHGCRFTSINSLVGTLSSAFGQLQALEQLYMRNNVVVGTRPSEFGRLRELERLIM